MSFQEAVEYSRKNDGAKVMREGGNVPMIVGEDGFVCDDNGDYYAFDIDDLLAKNWRPNIEGIRCTDTYHFKIKKSLT